VEKRSFCNILIFFIFIFLFANNIIPAVFTGIGDAVIEDNNLKIAEIAAKNNAIENSIYNYLKSKISESNTIPEITSEFFKFLRSYKIISRNVENYRVTYTIESDIIDFDIEEVFHMVKKLVTSAVYIVNVKGDLEDIEENEINAFVDKKFNNYNIETKYESDYLFALHNKEDFDEVIKSFANSKAQYLFILLIDSNITRIDQKVYCRVEILTNIYTRESKSKPIKTISTSIAEDPKKALTLSLNKSLDKMLIYVNNNIIKLSKNSNSINSFNINFLNFNRIAEVYELLNFMTGRGWVSSYNIGTFGREKVVVEIKTSFSPEELIEKVYKYNENNNFDIVLKNKEIELIFKSL
jgi:hypothetical protein